MVIASRVLRNKNYLSSAENALEFIYHTMWKNQRLFATYKIAGTKGKAHLDAYLDDYAFLLDAILEILQLRWNSSEIKWAQEIADVILDQFEDTEVGGFYFTAREHEQLIQRPKTLSDDATPSGNGIAAFALARLGYILAEPKYIQAAERTLKFASQSINQSPIGHNSLLHAYEEQQEPPQIIILRGDQENITRWQIACFHGYAPQRMVFAISNDVTDLPEAIAEKKFKDSSAEGVTAYVCNGNHCAAPIESFTEFKNILEGTCVHATSH